MYKLIYDLNELKFFFDNILPPLDKDEVYFVSLSARNKYLNEKEKRELGLGRTEMFERRIIRYKDWNRFLRTLRKFEVNDGAFLTKNNKNIPNDIITCYFNINPSSSLKAYQKFNKIMIDYLFELSSCYLKNQDTTNILNRINKQDVLLMNCYQQCRDTKHWIDIDIDIPKNYFYILEEIYNKFNPVGYLIETKSGYHWLLSKFNNRFNQNFNPKKFVEEIKKYYIEKIGEKQKEDMEIIINNNEMIPIPGLLQAGFPVKVIKKF